MKVPEQYRVKNHPLLGSSPEMGCNGFFVIPHHRIADYFYNCMVSDGMGWEHVSVTLTKKISASRSIPVERCCTWEEMCFMKDVFWEKQEAVMQVHPPEKDYVSNHHFCLHLWKPASGFPLPDPVMVGIPSKQVHL